VGMGASPNEGDRYGPGPLATIKCGVGTMIACVFVGIRSSHGFNPVAGLRLLAVDPESFPPETGPRRIFPLAVAAGRAEGGGDPGDAKSS